MWVMTRAYQGEGMRLLRRGSRRGLFPSRVERADLPAGRPRHGTPEHLARFERVVRLLAVTQQCLKHAALPVGVSPRQRLVPSADLRRRGDQRLDWVGAVLVEV